MGDNRCEDSKDPESFDSYHDFSQTSVADALVVPLDTSEDAHFSEELFFNIQERLARINKRVRLANTAMAHMKRTLRARMCVKNLVVEEADHFAGGDHAQRQNETSGI
ncbi:hypothetical protein KR009_000786, partial [Drosophila setifemur]